MGIRVEVIGFDGVAAALKSLRRSIWLHDADASGRRLKWHKKRHDHFLKPSQLRHRRDRTILRMKRHDWRYPALDGPIGWHFDDDLHWA
jgi:hypothetical protein